MKQLPSSVVMLTNDQYFEPGVQIAGDLGEYVRFLANFGITYDAAHSQVDNWLAEHGRVLVGITPALTHVHGYGAKVSTGYVAPSDGMPQGGMANAYLLGFTPPPSERADAKGHQMLFIIPALNDSNPISMWVWPPHARTQDDCKLLPSYDPDVMQHIQGRRAEERIQDVPLAPHILKSLN